MSLPTAPKDISDHPKPGSVVDPVNKADKEADVDRKIRFYGVIQAFRQGRMPDNAQIEETLSYVQRTTPFPLDQLSPEGQKLVQDSRAIIGTAREIVAQKNADELFQNFVWHTRAVDVDVEQATKDPSEAVPVSQEQAQADGQEALKHLRTLLSLVLTNSEVRKLLSDFSLIGRDLLARGVSKVATSLRPDPEALAHVDESAPNDQFATEDGRAAGPNETPILEARLPGTGHVVQQHPEDELGTGATVKTENGEEVSGREACARGQGTAQELWEQSQETAQEGTDKARDEANDVDDSGDAQVKAKGFMGKMRGMRDRIPQQHKDTASGHIDRGRRFLEEEFPEQRRDQFIYRGKKAIIECQRHDDYQAAIQWLLSAIEAYAAHTQTLTAHAQSSSASFIAAPALRQATRELRALLERFAGGRSLDVVFDACNTLAQDARGDAALRAWFREVDAYARKVLLDAGFVLEPECGRQAAALRDAGRAFYDGQYKGHFDAVFAGAGAWLGALGADALNRRFGDDWARLMRDLLFDEGGDLVFKKMLWGDIRKVILPAVVDKVGYIPIPCVEYTDDSYDIVIENLTLSGRNLFPNVVSVEAHNFVKFSPYSAITEDEHHEFTLTLAQMQADIRDVAFSFRKKSGVPKMRDSGIADVVLGGEGMTVTVHIRAAGNDRSSVFKVTDIAVKVDSLKFSIRDSKHDLLYKTLRPLATGAIKRAVKKVMRENIRTALEYADGQMAAVRDRLARAKAADGESRTQVLQDMMKEKKEDASATVKAPSGGHVKIGHNTSDLLIPDAGHPSGIANRTTEMENVAGQGKDWRSEAFNIV